MFSNLNNRLVIQPNQTYLNTCQEIILLQNIHTLHYFSFAEIITCCTETSPHYVKHTYYKAVVFWTFGKQTFQCLQHFPKGRVFDCKMLEAFHFELTKNCDKTFLNNLRCAYLPQVSRWTNGDPDERPNSSQLLVTNRSEVAALDVALPLNIIIFL